MFQIISQGKLRHKSRNGCVARCEQSPCGRQSFFEASFLSGCGPPSCVSAPKSSRTRSSFSQGKKKKTKHIRARQPHEAAHPCPCSDLGGVRCGRDKRDMDPRAQDWPRWLRGVTRHPCALCRAILGRGPRFTRLDSGRAGIRIQDHFYERGSHPRGQSTLCGWAFLCPVF